VHAHLPGRWRELLWIKPDALQRGNIGRSIGE
jgi:nucleoside diphosphate kinase